MDHAGRLQRLQERVGGLDADALLVSNLTNVRYLTGFSGTNAQVLVTPETAVFFTDGRYEARARALVSGLDIDIYLTRLTDVLAPRLSALGVRRLGIEAASTTIAERDDLARRLGEVELVAVKDAVEELRRAKDREEIAAIRAAAELADRAFAWVLDRLQPGRTEREIALDLEFYIRRQGADDVSFEPIVGSGPLSAHIHHTPTERTLEKGDLVLLDFGARLDGYCSDLTRTVVLGGATSEQRDTYDLVLAAQRAALAAMSVGAGGRDVDAAARAVISEGGHGDHFGHGLGHGVGLEIHESPRLSRISEDTLVAGDVVTNEPGVYVPGQGGIRIEDCVLVAPEGARVLSGAPRDELIEL